LKAKGKAIIAITHDDRYFDMADKLITLNDGVVRSVHEKMQTTQTAHVAIQADGCALV